MTRPQKVREIRVARWKRIRDFDETSLEGGGLRFEFRPRVAPRIGAMLAGMMGTSEAAKPRSEQPDRPTWHLAKFWLGGLLWMAAFLVLWGSLFKILHGSVISETPEETISLIALGISVVVAGSLFSYRFIFDRSHPGLNEHQILVADSDGLRYARSSSTGPLRGLLDSYQEGRNAFSRPDIESIEVEEVTHPKKTSRNRTTALVIRADGQRRELGHGIDVTDLEEIARKLRKVLKTADRDETPYPSPPS